MGHVRGIITKCEHKLNSGHASEAAKIHALRVTTKKLRSLWRLARRRIGEPTFERENGKLRALARDFSKLRDAEVLGRLSRRVGEKPPRAKPGRLGFRRSLRVLHDSAQRLERELQTLSTGDLKKDFRRSMRTSARWFARCRTSGASPQDFHHWRRRAKDLLYQADFMRKSGVKRHALKPRLKKLTDTLGDAHDLQMLAEYLKSRGRPPALVTRVRDRRRKLERKSLKQGERLKLG
jgi:CHAD domain-containing protein